MEYKMNYELIRNMCLSLGMDEFFKKISNDFPDLKFFSMSTDWLESSEYILKFKGACGDVIFSWL